MSELIAFSSTSKSGIIDTVATLWNLKMNRKGFLTIGGSQVTTADVKLPHEMVKTQNSSSKLRMVPMSEFVTNPRKPLRAIGLLYGRMNPFPDIVLTEKAKVLLINDKLVDVLQKHLVDLVVYAGDKNMCDKCEFIERIHSDYSKKKIRIT